ncbi:MAG: aminomethyltransferase beta-barrel domain-containing protein, partial [Minisyncoccia bacterium]
YYVVAKNIENNTITVSQNPAVDSVQENQITLDTVVDNQGILNAGMTIESQIRYRGEVKKIDIISFDRNEKTMTISFHESDASLAPGQSVVFYGGDVCLGGGIIA